jgi:hypothetical protein
MGIQRLQPVSGGTDWSKMTPMAVRYGNYTGNLNAGASLTLASISGKGIVTDITVTIPNHDLLEVKIEIDGTPLNIAYGYISGSITYKRNPAIITGSGSLYTIKLSTPIRFNSSFVLSVINNNNVSESLANIRSTVIYYV